MGKVHRNLQYFLLFWCMTMTVVFETTRLVLKRFSLADAQGFYRLNLDPEVIRYTGDIPFASVAEAESFIRSYDHYERYGFGRWSVFIRDSGDYIGFCGLNYKVALDEVDVGFRFLKRYWGKGYATEAARGCLLYGFKEYALDRIVARAMQDNLASHRVLKKLGCASRRFSKWRGQIGFNTRLLRRSTSGTFFLRISKPIGKPAQRHPELPRWTVAIRRGLVSR